MADGTGSETYTYDQLGRITNVAKVVGTANYNIGYGYNYVGQIKMLTYPDGIAVNQSYDPAGRLAQISSGGTNYLIVPSSSYNAASQPTALTYGSGVQATIAYNSRLQLLSLDYAKGSTDLLNLTYNYTQTVSGNTVNNGQIQGVTDTRGNAYSTSYTYDALGRLSQGQTLNLTAANTWKIGWVYDRYGNRSQQNLLGGTISTTSPQLTIIPATNRIDTNGTGFGYDDAGNLTADGTSNSYTYDAENRLKTLNTGTTTATYSYDGKRLRVKKVVGANTTVYVFSGSKVIAEYANGTPSVKYVYAGSQLLATLYQSLTTPVVYHYPDQLSARLETNPNGVVTRTFGHLPFGETWYETGSPVKQKFTSYERDTESGLDYAVFRYDSSRLGRFMTTDLLIGSPRNPQSLNRYAYVSNDPVNLVDPKGLDDFWACFLDASSNGHCGTPGTGGGPIGGPGWGTNFWWGYSAEEAQYDAQVAAAFSSDPCVYLNDAGTGVESVDQNSSPGECQATGGQWIPPQPPGTIYGVSNGYAYPIFPQSSLEQRCAKWGLINGAWGSFNLGLGIYSLIPEPAEPGLLIATAISGTANGISGALQWAICP